MNKERLLNVARALRESPEPKAFSMKWWGWGGPTSEFPCGTPMCAMGHYAARGDLQDAFYLTEAGMVRRTDNNNSIGTDSKYLLDHFDLGMYDANCLFSPHGCGHAQTNIQAAEYIERFVAAR